MSATDPAHPLAQKSLAHLPLPLFAAPMGVGGLGLAWREAGRSLGAPAFVGEAILALAALIWLAVAALHLTRWARHPEAFAGDLKHPIRAAFAGAITIGLMIIAGGLIPYSQPLASAVWLVAVAGHLLIGVWTIRGLFLAPRESATLTPALLIPLVGNVLAPVFGMKLGYVTLSTMLFGVGALLWAMVQPILLWRLIVGPALMDRLKPMLAIFIAPPSVGAIALAQITGGVTPGVLMIYGLAAFIVATVLTFLPFYLKMHFGMPWWGWTFPAAAFSVATSMVVHATGHGSAFASAAAWLVLAGASVVVALVALATARAAAQGHLLLPE